jgi:hypothetical protein
MNSRFNTYFIFGFLLLTLELLAQERFFKNELLIGGGLHTRGYNITAEYLLFKTDKKAFCFHMEFSEIKSPKQKKINSERLAIGGNNSRSYIYGKQNNLFSYRVGAGQYLYISEKSEKSVVAIAFSYNAGLSLGMLKPYYLDLIYRLDPGGFRINSEKYTEENRLKFLEPLDINGASSSSAGWDELTISPGIYSKASLIFDWGPKDDFAKMLEVGVMCDIYFRKMPIMIDEVRPPVFVNLFMNFYFGKRW